MGKKYKYKEVKEFVELLGYELISKTYIGVHTKIIIKDHEGYFYTIIFKDLKNNTIPNKFHPSNPYTIQNIILWCDLNSKLFKLVENQIYENSVNKLKWQCLKENCGEIFKSNWNNIYNGNGCGVCYGQQVTLLNCLATKYPDLVKEWHPTKNGKLTPYDVTCGSEKEAWWKCKEGHEWHTTIKDRNILGCPYCSGRYPTETNNLLINNPELCKEWDYSKNIKNPEEYTPYSSEYVWWTCKECGHEWFTSIAHRNYTKSGCSECYRNNNRGENHPCWKGGLSSENHKIRQSLEYKQWRLDVFTRDQFTCQCCGDNKGGNLEAHHKYNFSDNPDLRFDVDFGIALCDKCHNPNIIGSFHHTYGTKNNTPEQLEQYINNYKESQRQLSLEVI